jgi:drug/metabolite transporter (DMT)-like permease
LDTIVFLAVLAAAVMHAGWNVLIKLNLDRFLSLCLLQFFMGIMGLVMLLSSPAPTPSCLPYALASGILHLGYNLFLVRSYRSGDLSQVYPIARGAAPLMTLVAAWIALDERPGLPGIAGIAILVGGVWFVSLAGRRAVRLDGMTLVYALGTSVFIAAYTIVDGLGGRLSGSPAAYAGTVFVLDTVMLLAVAFATRGSGIVRKMAPHWPAGLAGGLLSGAGYGIAIWAMTKAPIAAVGALRETSILVVMVLSMRVLKEEVTAHRLAGAALIAAGAVLIRLS